MAAGLERFKSRIDRMKYLKKTFSLLIVFLFIFGVFLIAQFSSKKLNSFVTTQTITNAIVAFFGAFFAFSFVKLGEIVNRKRKRNVEHINAVIKFQHIFNKSINSLQQSKTFLDNSVKALEAKKILTLSFFELPIHDELVYDLKNIDFMNEVYAIFRDYEAINLDLHTLTSSYNEVKNFFFENKISKEDFIFNVKEYTERMSKLSNYLWEIKIKSIRLFAISRILAREDKKWNFFFGPHVGKHYSKKFNEILKSKMTEVEKEFQPDNA